jgi:hypothetical protein
MYQMVHNGGAVRGLAGDRREARGSFVNGPGGFRLADVHAPAGQLLYSGADLRCRRGALGLPEQDAAVLLGAPVGALRAWEADTGPVPELTAVLARMADVERVADRITGELVEEARRSGRIVTFRTDAGAMQAGAAMGVAVLHRICAGRAWEERNDAQLVFADARPVDSGGPDRRAE